MSVAVQLPAWATWSSSASYSVGLEEEVMLLEPGGWMLAQRAGSVAAEMPDSVPGTISLETHQAVLELATVPHATATAVAHQAAELRRALADELQRHGLAAAAAGTHPSATWQETEVSTGARYQEVHRTMRELARREPTFALHVHVGVRDADEAIVLLNRMRRHLPVLLALSANSPYWQGRDTGMASIRTPLFGMFPRVGIPRHFDGYADYVRTVDAMIRAGAFPEPTFLWWDIRPQATLGTVEVRIMDAQSSVSRSEALVALVQSLARMELEDDDRPDVDVSPEIVAENRFLAARDGMQAELIDAVGGRRVPVTELLEELLDGTGAHAQALGCEAALARVRGIALDPGYARQRRQAEGSDLAALAGALAAEFLRGC